MITSKLTRKAQTTIPQAVRGAAYIIEDGRVLLTKAEPRTPRRGNPFEDPFAAFWEWNTQEDDTAFANL